jgi:alanine racemase
VPKHRRAKIGFAMAQHHVEVRVSRATFFDNIRTLRQTVAPAKLCVVMKSNAYGHGLAELAPVAVEAGANYIGICTNPEAEAIRGLGLNIPLLRLRLALPAEIDQSAAEVLGMKGLEVVGMMSHFPGSDGADLTPRSRN